MMLVNVVLKLCCIVVMTSLASSQSTAGSECCGLTLMDSNQRVAIETTRTLTTGTFFAVQIRLCTSDAIAIQIWTQVSDTEFAFKWQTVILPTTTQTSLNFAVINFDVNNPLTITADDRFGIYSSATNVYSVPYGFDTTSDYMYYTASHFSNVTSFVPGTTVTMESLRWPRSFVGSLIFCSQLNCPGFTAQSSPGFLAADTPAAEQTTTTSRPSQQGPPGPQGPGGGCCGGNQAPSCDPGQVVTSGLQSQSSAINALQDAVNTMSAQLRDLVSTTVVAGVCPQGFIPGTYGVGKCYLAFRIPATFSSAILDCINYGASLLEIESDAEERFVRSILGNSTIAGESVDSYWTAGMYNAGTKTWVWYDTATYVTVSMNYKKWQNGIVPTPNSPNNICLLLEVDFVANADYWTYGSCYTNNYYICETPKQCM